MEELLHGIEGVSVYLDDILVKGSTREEHDKTLRLVLSKLQSAGLDAELKERREDAKITPHTLSNYKLKQHQCSTLSCLMAHSVHVSV